MSSPAQILDQAQRTALAQQLPDPGKLNKYIQQWGGVSKLYAFMHAIGAANFATLANDYHPDKLRGVYLDLPEQLRVQAMQILANLSNVERLRIRDLYPHVVTNEGGYALNTMAQASVLEALSIQGPFAAHLSGANIPLNPVTGLLGDITRANQLYTVLAAPASAQKNYVFNSVGICVAEVDFGNHGGDAVSGHCHPFGLPGCVAFAHHNAGGVHLSLTGYPIAWRALPALVAPAVPLGT